MTPTQIPSEQQLCHELAVLCGKVGYKEGGADSLSRVPGLTGLIIVGGPDLPKSPSEWEERREALRAVLGEVANCEVAEQLDERYETAALKVFLLDLDGPVHRQKHPSLTRIQEGLNELFGEAPTGRDFLKKHRPILFEVVAKSLAAREKEARKQAEQGSSPKSPIESIKEGDRLATKLSLLAFGGKRPRLITEEQPVDQLLFDFARHIHALHFACWLVVQHAADLVAASDDGDHDEDEAQFLNSARRFLLGAGLPGLGERPESLMRAAVRSSQGEVDSFLEYLEARLRGQKLLEGWRAWAVYSTAIDMRRCFRCLLHELERKQIGKRVANALEEMEEDEEAMQSFIAYSLLEFQIRYSPDKPSS